MAFRADVRTRDGVAVLDLTGDVDRDAAEVLTTTHELALDGLPRALVLNFRDVDYINSSGIALIVTVLARAKQDGRAVRAVGLTDHYRHVFEITRITDFMSMYDDEDAALAAGVPAGS